MGLLKKPDPASRFKMRVEQFSLYMYIRILYIYIIVCMYIYILFLLEKPGFRKCRKSVTIIGF